MSRFPIVEDLLHCTMMNIAASIDLETDHRWKIKVTYAGRVLTRQTISDLPLWLISHLKGVC